MKYSVLQLKKIYLGRIGLAAILSLLLIFAMAPQSVYAGSGGTAGNPGSVTLTPSSDAINLNMWQADTSLALDIKCDISGTGEGTDYYDGQLKVTKVSGSDLGLIVSVVGVGTPPGNPFGIDEMQPVGLFTASGIPVTLKARNPGSAVYRVTVYEKAGDGGHELGHAEITMNCTYNAGNLISFTPDQNAVTIETTPGYAGTLLNIIAGKTGFAPEDYYQAHVKLVRKAGDPDLGVKIQAPGIGEPPNAPYGETDGFLPFGLADYGIVLPATLTATNRYGGVADYKIEIYSNDKTTKIGESPYVRVTAKASLNPTISFDKNSLKNVYELKSGGTFQIKADVDFALFAGRVDIDDRTVATSDYTAASGSTIITFKESYMKSLKPGQHSVDVHFQNGLVVKGSFTVTDQANSPKTGDNASLYGWILLMALSAACITIVAVRKRRKGKATA
jgi:hypothetical protein